MSEAAVHREAKLPTLSYLLLDPAKPFIHRDLSWIQFNDRVLAEARSSSNPLLKRLKFLAICSSNLDEFFMIRFSSLLRSLAAMKIEESRANLTRVHGTVLESVRTFVERQQRAFEALRKESALEKINLHLRLATDHPAFALGAKIFEEKILPQLVMKSGFTYHAVNELENTQLLVYLNKDLYFEVPRSLPPLFWEQNAASGELEVFFLDALLESHLDRMLPIKEKPGILRITRDADFTIEIPDGDTESIPDLVRKSIGSRDKGRSVRLQHSGVFPKDFLPELADHLKLDLRQIFRAPATLCLHGLLSFVNNLPEKISERPGYSNPPLRAKLPTLFKTPAKIFETIDQADFMLHHPYDSFEAFLSWLRLACEDPHVTMIEQTIYRTDSVSEIVDLLKLAAPKKKVRVILELRARFDESNNLRIAEELAKAGAEVKFGFGLLKLHAKVTLVTRKHGDKVVRYTHLSTGNYSARTARQYTDISILTAHPEIGEDARYFFDAVFRKDVPTGFKQLVTAPAKLHQKMRALIKTETEAAKAGKKGRIVAKVNALVDEKIIEDLYLASQAGVSVDLIVRGACSLIPGVKGLSENIRVISIVDRFLEHSRIYYFEQSHAMYLSSADWMPRNFFSRLEIAFPVLDPRIFSFITDFVIPGYLKDNVRARRLTSRGVWAKVPKKDQLHRAQWYFEELAIKGYAQTPLRDQRFLKPSSKS